LVESVWESREVPLLEAIAKSESGPGDNTTESIAELAGLPPRDASLGLRALFEADFITGIDVTTMAGLPFQLIGIRLHERGRRATGQWPAEEPARVLVEILNARISSAKDEAERTRLEAARDALLDIGKDVLTSVLSSFARQVAGLP